MATHYRSGSELKDAREDAGLSQEQVAKALGVHRTTVITWEGKSLVRGIKADRYLRVVSDLATSADPALHPSPPGKAA